MHIQGKNDIGHLDINGKNCKAKYAVSPKMSATIENHNKLPINYNQTKKIDWEALIGRSYIGF